MRRDFKLDNRKVWLPNASTLGYGLSYAKRGNWIKTTEFSARVLGRVTCERKVYLYVFKANPMALRWVDAGEVLSCTEKPPADLIKLLTMSFAHPEQVIDELQDYFGDPLSLGEQ